MLRIGRMVYATQEDKDQHDRSRRECPQSLDHRLPGRCGWGRLECTENRACWYQEAVSEASKRATEETYGEWNPPLAQVE